MTPSIDFHSGINQGVAPVTYGQGERPPRGDYAQARADYTCEQDWAAYTPEQHALYRRLYERQIGQLPGLACDEFIAAVQNLGEPSLIPRFEALSETLYRATKWQVVAVPGLIPEEAFFALLANRKFPVTGWLRKPEEFDYVVEPDVFHDLFGHVPLLFNPMFADYMQAYGAGGLKATRLQACEYLARLYWYTVEFGLITTPAGLRAYGAGILSSGGELFRDRFVRAADGGDRAGLHADLCAGGGAARARSRWTCAGRSRAWFGVGQGVSSQRPSSLNTASAATIWTCAVAARWRLSAPASVAVRGGNTMLSQWP
jgi:phenylalanine-4-hydroxylase